MIADVLGYFSEPAEAFVRRRHRELQSRGLTNDRAFELIAAELPLRRVGCPPFSPPPPRPLLSRCMRRVCVVGACAYLGARSRA